jgi:hypothetical protein
MKGAHLDRVLRSLEPPMRALSRQALVLGAALLVSASASESGFAISPVVTGGVLQHGQNVTVWGSGAPPDAVVAVTLHTPTPPYHVVVDGIAGPDGGWSVSLPAQPVRWNAQLDALETTNGVKLSTNVSFGIVTLCAGQSNMDMPVACHMTNKTACFFPKPAFHADNGTSEVAAAGRYANKIFMIKAVNSKYEKTHGPEWQTASPATTYTSFPAAFSAVCWYTGKSLYEQLGGTT